MIIIVRHKKKSSVREVIKTIRIKGGEVQSNTIVVMLNI